MHYVYVLRSGKDNKLYVGYTENLDRRMMEHQTGKVKSTHHRLPLTLIYYEAYLVEADARGREKFPKSGSGHMFINKQLRNYFNLK